MIDDECLEKSAGFVKSALQEVLVEREIQIVEADDGHRDGPHFFLELLRDTQLLGGELVVAVQDAHFDDGLDHVLQQGVCSFVRAAVLSRQLVHVVQQTSRGLVDEDFGDFLGRHLP